MKKFKEEVKQGKLVQTGKKDRMEGEKDKQKRG